MSDRLKELRNKRGRLVHEMRALLDQADGEGRGLSEEENAKYSEMFEAQDGLRGDIEREERQVELDRAMAGAAAEAERGRDPGHDRVDPAAPAEGDDIKAFRRFLRGGVAALSETERRALEATDDPSGGYTVGPEQFVRQLIKNVDDMVFVRSRATSFTITTNESLGVPTLEADPADADWTSELATGNEDTAMKFGKRSLTPSPVAKRIKVSKKLLRASALPIEQIVMSRLSYKFGITHEKAFLTGSGVAQPLGLFTASNDGIPTGRDVSSGNTSTTIEADGLIAAKYALKGQYWQRADWMFNRTALEHIAKLKDGDGQYLWRMSLREGEPDRILGRPVMMSEYVPNTFTTGLYVGLLGDLSNYWIVDALGMQFQRLVELYAESNQDGFIGRLESDGMPVLAEAFVRVTLA